MQSITCPTCRKTSWNENDVKNRYCGLCHAFIDDAIINVSVPVNHIVWKLLSVLGEPPQVIAKLVDHAQQGVYRPGAWERMWLEQAFGEQWTEKLEPGDPYGRGGCENIFQKPRET